MPISRRPRFGIKTSPQHTTYEDILRVWQEADTVPELEHAWISDHFAAMDTDRTNPRFESWTLLAALAARTERLRVGVMVTGNTYRHPAVLANMGATLDVISHGRLDMGLGAGWNESEHTAYSIPLPPTGERIRRLGEACEVLQRMWMEEAPDFAGRYYELRGARCEPKPLQRPHPPLVIGGKGEQLTLRIVAQYADIWNMDGGSVEEFAAKSAMLDQHCVAVGRNPATIARSIQVHADPDQPKAVRTAVRAYQAVGASHIVLVLPLPFRSGMAHRLAAGVAAPLLAEATW
jgi:F420-dependent oxidoreductase-like protein